MLSGEWWGIPMAVESLCSNRRFDEQKHSESLSDTGGPCQWSCS